MHNVVSLHSDSVILNPDLFNARETEKERLKKFVAVKVTKKVVGVLKIQNFLKFAQFKIIKHLGKKMQH